MTYAMSQNLQAAIYDRLASDPAIDALVGGAVFDFVPEAAPDLFVALGPERAVGVTDSSGSGAVHRLRISVVTRREGYLAAKKVAAAVSDAMAGPDLILSRGRVASLRFLRAEARRDKTEGTRRVDLWFRARTDEQSNPDDTQNEANT